MTITPAVKIIKSIDDITDDMQYVNIDIVLSDINVLKKLITLQKDILVADIYEERSGYIYTDFLTFCDSAKTIIKFIDNIDESFNEIEKSRYIYTKLGKVLKTDINADMEKNDDFDFNKIGQSLNIFSALKYGYASSETICKLYMYICRLAKIDCFVRYEKETDKRVNIIKTSSGILKVCLPKDLSFLAAGFKTHNFDVYNDETSIDKKIGYIKNEYNDELIDRKIKNIDYKNEDYLIKILTCINDVVNVKEVGPVEMKIIYEMFLQKYAKDTNFQINNLYYFQNQQKKHFLMINILGKHLCYNYALEDYTELSDELLKKSLQNGEIGYYHNEEINVFSKGL